MWLREGREHRGMSLDDVARVTKIQPRILERLEAGKLDGLPADVFVRGFVRNFARCVGLDECEALRRYAACALGSQDLTPTVHALVEAMSELAPDSATSSSAASRARATPHKMQAVEVIDLASPAALAEATPSEVVAPVAGVGGVEPREAAPAVAVEPAAPGASSKKKRGRRRKARAAAAAGAVGMPRAQLAVGTPPTASPIVASLESSEADAESDECDDVAAAPEIAAPAIPALDDAPVAAPGSSGRSSSSSLSSTSSSWGAPWRRSAHRLASGSLPPGTVSPASLAPGSSSTGMRSHPPSLVIDDADPDRAERVLEERAENLAPRRSFLPPILLDREDRSARQGGLTLAVILLLIAATLTLSYLMRRPGASGDGMTAREAPARLG